MGKVVFFCEKLKPNLRPNSFRKNLTYSGREGRLRMPIGLDRDGKFEPRSPTAKRQNIVESFGTERFTLILWLMRFKAVRYVCTCTKYIFIVLNKATA